MVGTMKVQLKLPAVRPKKNHRDALLAANCLTAIITTKKSRRAATRLDAPVMHLWLCCTQNLFVRCARKTNAAATIICTIYYTTDGRSVASVVLFCVSV